MDVCSKTGEGNQSGALNNTWKAEIGPMGGDLGSQGRGRGVLRSSSLDWARKGVQWVERSKWRERDQMLPRQAPSLYAVPTEFTHFHLVFLDVLQVDCNQHV